MDNKNTRIDFNTIVNKTEEDGIIHNSERHSYRKFSAKVHMHDAIQAYFDLLDKCDEERITRNELDIQVIDKLDLDEEKHTGYGYVQITLSLGQSHNLEEVTFNGISNENNI